MIKHQEASAYKENYEAIADVLAQNDLLKLNHGAEVGVRYGVFSEFLLDRFPALLMTLVDPYSPYQDVFEFYTQEKQDAIFKDAQARMARFSDRARWLQEPSCDAADKITREGAFFDFIFVDASHALDDVRADITAWSGRVRAGGVFCGHDYNFAEVKKAVDEFANGRTVHHIGSPAHVWILEN